MNRYLLLAIAAAGVSLANVTPAAGRGLPAEAEFNLPARNGYLVTVGGSGHRATLVVSRRHELAAYVSTEARVTRNSIRAGFGRFGAVDVTLAGGRATWRAPHNRHPLCRLSPRRVRYRSGVFIGSIRFRGEHGFTSIHARRAPGRVAARPHSLCGRVGPARSFEELEAPSGWPTSLSALVYSFHGQMLFSAGRNAFDLLRRISHPGRLRLPKLGRREVGFTALSQIERGPLSIFRAVVAAGGPRSYDFAESPRNLLVTPPPPFSGIGRYRRCADREWTGSLTVSMPGAGRASLTGKSPGEFFADAFAIPEFHDSQCVVIPLSQSRLHP